MLMHLFSVLITGFIYSPLSSYELFSIWNPTTIVSWIKASVYPPHITPIWLCFEIFLARRFLPLSCDYLLPLNHVWSSSEISIMHALLKQLHQFPFLQHTVSHSISPSCLLWHNHPWWQSSIFSFIPPIHSTASLTNCFC